MKYNDTAQKIFLIVNLSCLGDILLTNPLCRNIKRSYPESKVVYLVNKPFYETAYYMQGADEVITFDKNNQGLAGILKFIYSFPYRNKIYAAFIIYGNLRGIILSYLLGAQRRISSSSKISDFFLTSIAPFKPNLLNTIEINNNLFTALTGKKAVNFPVKYNILQDNKLAADLKKNYKNLIGLCCISEEPEKNMPLETAAEIINILHAQNKTVCLLGKGRETRIFADKLKNSACAEFIDLTDKTSIYDAACAISVCIGMISIDTGLMHLAYSVNTPVVCLFYKGSIQSEKWAPNPAQYDVYIENKCFSAENICFRLEELLKLCRNRYFA